MGMGDHHKQGKGMAVWLTPPEIIEAVGPFDLDPCYGEPRPLPTASRYFGPKEDGLAQPWDGMVWCNPPYGAHGWKWLARCALHGSAIALIFARTEVEQFHRQVWEKADALLFLEGRLYFHHADGKVAANNSGAPSVLVAYGTEACDRLKYSCLTGQYVGLTGG